MLRMGAGLEWDWKAGHETDSMAALDGNGLTKVGKNPDLFIKNKKVGFKKNLNQIFFI